MLPNKIFMNEISSQLNYCRAYCWLIFNFRAKPDLRIILMLCSQEVEKEPQDFWIRIMYWGCERGNHPESIRIKKNLTYPHVSLKTGTQQCAALILPALSWKYVPCICMKHKIELNWFHVLYGVSPFVSIARVLRELQHLLSIYSRAISYLNLLHGYPTLKGHRCIFLL